MKIADEIAKVFNTEVVKLYNIQNIGIIDTAELPTKPYNINHVKTAALTGAVGLVVGLGIVFVLFYFDTTIKSSEEVERKLGLPVIGTIPVRGGK
jgi:capsular polysaccharide biosynthesis protein